MSNLSPDKKKNDNLIGLFKGLSKNSKKRHYHLYI
jgi:hypothetical protein